MTSGSGVAMNCTKSTPCRQNSIGLPRRVLLTFNCVYESFAPLRVFYDLQLRGYYGHSCLLMLLLSS